MRDHTGIRVRHPIGFEHRATSFVGKLALGLVFQLRDARSHVTCPYCRSVELFPDLYKHVTCGRDACKAKYRREWKLTHKNDVPVGKHKMRPTARRKGGRR